MKMSKATSTILKSLPLFSVLTFTVLFMTFGKNITFDQLLNYTPENKLLAAIVIIVMFGLKSLTVFFPIMLLMLVSGAIFSTFTAIIVNIIGVIVCISVPYFIGRFSGGEMAEKLISKNEKLRLLADYQQKNRFFFSYFVRVLGFLPCDIVSLYIGSVKIPYLIYISGSILGFLPGLISATIIGYSITNPKSPAFIISCAFTVILSVSSFLVYTFIIKRKNKKT